ncbi:isochorismatase family protein, partial [Pseudomonas viridiflava]
MSGRFAFTRRIQPRCGLCRVTVKKHINAFRETDLKHQLEAFGVQQVVVIGAMSHMCIDAVV